MRRNAIETVMGGVVLVVAALFLWTAYRMADINVLPGYRLTASFSGLGGLPIGSEVRVNGVRVGTVSDRFLDPKDFQAIVTMDIDRSVKLPEDSVASVSSEGVLGGKFIRIEPGHAPATIAPGGAIKRTEPYRSLEDQVGEIIFLATGNRGESAKP